MTATVQIEKRLGTIDWEKQEQSLDSCGWTIISGLLSAADCEAVKSIYNDDSAFRNRVVMARHGYGKGEYRYFSYPLPSLVATLRRSLYASLVPLANRWNEVMKVKARFPESHGAFIKRCHAAGQLRPTPLLLQYCEGDYNCLHQDLYGEQLFPLQVAILLSDPAGDFEGGEFVLTEQRPRMQSRVTVVPLRKGDAVVFAVNNRPVQGTRGFYRMKLRHGVSTIRAGQRHTLGIIFHDAQ